MNAVEHIVECYFRYVKKCFTKSDVKVTGGNNRQFDLLAYDLEKSIQYHVESSVTHQENWSPTIEKLKETFGKKFLGAPAERKGDNTDVAKGKNYLEQINSAYKNEGFEPMKVKRIFVTWQVDDIVGLQDFLNEFKREHFEVEVLSFRDELMPVLSGAIGTSHYEDEVLRTFSLIAQRQAQIEKR